jgi:molybdopterin-binding protein
MKISARNALKGTVKQVIPGTVNAEVVVEVAPGVDIVSVITQTSSEQLDLTLGQEVYAIVKASNVMLALE